MPAFLALPIELIDQVITTATHSKDDDDDDYPIPALISSCSLVCKTFYRIARGLQFNAVSCTLTEDEAQILPELLTYQHEDLSLPPLAHYVRHLDIKFDFALHAFDDGYLDHLDAFLAPFSGDACRIRYFTFGAEKGPYKTQIIYPTTLSWHELLPSTQQAFSDIFQSSTLESVDIRGVLDLPFRLLQDITPNAKFLSLAATSVAIEPGDLEESRAHLSRPSLTLEELYIGGLEFKMVRPHVASPTSETNEPDVAFDVALSRLTDLSKLDTLAVLKVLRGSRIKGSIPPLKELFARCSNLQVFELEFDHCAELYSLPLDKIPSSVASIELTGYSSLSFETGLDGGVDNQAMFSRIGEPAVLPKGIATASSKNPELPEVTISLPIFIRHSKPPQIEGLVLADGVTSYWDALLENLRTIPASRIYLNILIGLEMDYISIFSRIPKPRPDERIEEEVDRVFDEYTTNNPDKPILVDYNCSILQRD